MKAGTHAKISHSCEVFWDILLRVIGLPIRRDGFKLTVMKLS